MSYSVPLEQMTTLDKLRAIEALWDDLSRSPGDVPSPEWHGPILSGHVAEANDNAANFMDWEEAKRALRDDLEQA